MSKVQAINERTTAAQRSMFLGGRMREFKFDLNAFAELEARYGTVEKAMAELMQGKIKDVRYILWAALIHEEVILDDFGEPKGYKITPYQVGGWVTPDCLNEMNEKLAAAMGMALPVAENEIQEDIVDKSNEVATVVLTEEEQRQEEEERKNG